MFIHFKSFWYNIYIIVHYKSSSYWGISRYPPFIEPPYGFCRTAMVRCPFLADYEAWHSGLGIFWWSISTITVSYMFVYKYSTGWWFGIFVMFHNIWDVILPIDFMFQDGFLTTKQCLYTNTIIMCFYSLTSSSGGPVHGKGFCFPAGIMPAYNLPDAEGNDAVMKIGWCGTFCS